MKKKKKELGNSNMLCYRRLSYRQKAQLCWFLETIQCLQVVGIGWLLQVVLKLCILIMRDKNKERLKTVNKQAKCKKQGTSKVAYQDPFITCRSPRPQRPSYAQRRQVSWNARAVVGENLGTQMMGGDIYVDASEDVYATASLRFSEHSEVAHPSC